MNLEIHVYLQLFGRSDDNKGCDQLKCKCKIPPFMSNKFPTSAFQHLNRALKMTTKNEKVSIAKTMLSLCVMFEIATVIVNNVGGVGW